MRHPFDPVSSLPPTGQICFQWEVATCCADREAYLTGLDEASLVHVIKGYKPEYGDVVSRELVISVTTADPLPTRTVEETVRRVSMTESN